MYARVSTYEGDAEDFDRGVEKVKAEVAPQVRAMSGSAGLLIMVDRSSGRSLSISLWDSEDTLASSREAAERAREEGAAINRSTITDVTEYEVGVADLT